MPRTLDGIQPGDIIIAVGVPDSYLRKIALRAIRTQSFIYKSKGLSYATHVGICHAPGKILHITGKVEEAEEKDIFDNPQFADLGFIIYRPKHRVIAAHIGATIHQDWQAGLFDHIKWDLAQTLPAVLPSFFHARQGYQKISPLTICSKFIIQNVKKSVALLGIATLNRFMGISSNSTPKSLDAYLGNNKEYEVLIKIPKGTFLRLLDHIEAILESYQHKPKKQQKYKNLSASYAHAKEKVFKKIAAGAETEESYSEYERCVDLMRIIHEDLKQKTGVGRSGQYTKTIEFLESHGIRKEDFTHPKTRRFRR